MTLSFTVLLFNREFGVTKTEKFPLHRDSSQAVDVQGEGLPTLDRRSGPSPGASYTHMVSVSTKPSAH